MEFKNKKEAESWLINKFPGLSSRLFLTRDLLEGLPEKSRPKEWKKEYDKVNKAIDALNRDFDKAKKIAGI